MPYKGGVQLLPETQQRPTLRAYTQRNGYFWFGVSVGVGLIVAMAIFSGYKGSIRDDIARIDAQLDQTEASRNKEREQELVAAAKQSKVLRQVLAGKLYWTQAFAEMERMTQSSVRFTRFDASATKGSIGFRGVAENYAAVARQIAAFTSGDGVRDVSLNSARSTPQGGIEFDGELRIDTKELLMKTLAQ